MASHRLDMSNRIECPERAQRVEGQAFFIRRSGWPVQAKSDQFFIYILRCADGAYYVGSTNDVAARVESHNAGRGPRFTACRRPVALVYSEPHATMESARGREVQIKKWSRGKKEALIAGNMDTLHELSRRRIRRAQFRPGIRQETSLSVFHRALGSVETAFPSRRLRQPAISA